MAMTVLLDNYGDHHKIAHVFVLVFWLGGGFGLLAFVKVKVNKPTLTTACSLVSLIASVIITKEVLIIYRSLKTLAEGHLAGRFPHWGVPVASDPPSRHHRSYWNLDLQRRVLRDLARLSHLETSVSSLQVLRLAAPENPLPPGSTSTRRSTLSRHFLRCSQRLSCSSACSAETHTFVVRH